MLNKLTPHSIHNKRKRSITIEGVNDTSDHCYTFKLEKEAADNEQFIRQICKLYEEEKLCDVTFRVGRERSLYKAHRVVLASANSFLSGLILSGLRESSQDVIDLPETDPTLFKCILDYLYSVQIEISYSNIIPLLGLANCYNMECLRDRLADILGSNLSISNSCSIFAAADAYNCEHLKSQSQEIIFSNFAAASKTEAFYNLSQALIEYVLRSDEILDCDEALLFEAVTRWIEHRPHEREPHCLPLLSLVRFPLMDSCFLSDVIKGHPLMKGAERSNLLMEAFEHHALLACGRAMGVATARAKKRRQSCSFTRSTLLNGHNDAVSCVVSLGDWLISGSWDSSIKVWATDTWICVRTLSDHTGSIRGLCVCNDKVVSCSDDGTIKVWSPGSWTCVRSMDGHDGAANVVLSCRGRLASAGDDGTIKLWGSTSWACEVTVHNQQIQEISAGNNYGVVAMHRFDVEVANVEEREPAPEDGGGGGGGRGRGRNRLDDEGDGAEGPRRVRRRQGQGHGGSDVEETDEDDDENDAPEGQEDEEEVEEEAAPQLRVGVMSLEVFEDKLFSGGDDSIVRIWNTNNWTCECILRAHSDEIWSIKMNGSDLITGSVDGTIRVWRQRQKQSQVVLHRSHSGAMLSTISIGNPLMNSNSGSNSGSGVMLTESSYGDGEVVAFHTYTGALGSSSTPEPMTRSSSFTSGADCEWICEYTVTSDGPVYSLCCLDGKVVSAGASNKISIWRPAMERSETWTLHRWFETEEADIWSLTVCKGRLISGGADGTVRVWT